MEEAQRRCDSAEFAEWVEFYAEQAGTPVTLDDKEALLMAQFKSAGGAVVS